MAVCKSCSAPLQANTNRCTYCGVRNDVDLHAKHEFSVAAKNSDRICPHCEKPLQTIRLELDKTIEIERCEDCFGLFFDLGEIEDLLHHSVSQVGGINLAHIDNINNDRYQKEQVVKYIKCPVCHEFMRRTIFAQKSGVIVDSCKRHGFWLDSGEVTHLMEWKKAGGQLLHDKMPEPKSKKLKSTLSYEREGGLWESSIFKENRGRGVETDLLDLFSFVAGKIF